MVLCEGESSPAAIRSDRSHPCGPERFDNIQKRSVDRSTGERLLRKIAAREEDENWPETHRFR